MEAAPSANEIIQHVLQAYGSATAYRDRAVLHLSYQLQGSYLEEPHAWEVAFERNRGFKSSIYEARLTADSDQLSCFIFDFGSGNLDNQWQIHPCGNASLPIRRLFQDGICRHYLTGQDELPVNHDQPLAADIFFPPTIGLLTGQQSPEWLTSGTATHLANEKIDGQDCYRINIEHQDMDWVLHIDIASYLVRQIRYPNALLDARLQDNPDVNHLEVVARFRQATWQPEFETALFKQEIPEDAKQVRRFVPVPEPFPSNNVGKRLTDLGLRDSSDQLVDQSDWNGKVTLLCWTDSTLDQTAITSQLEAVAKDLSVKQYHVAKVEVIQGALPGNPQIAEQLRRLATESGLPVLADYGFNAGRALGLKHYPVLAVIDRQGILQYVKRLQDEPLDPSELSSVLLRVRSGDDVAGEMRREYESFLNLYRERLSTVAAQEKFGRDDGELVESGAPDHMKVRELWTNRQLQQPGNLRSHNQQLTMLDGWRTILQIDADGQVQHRKQLELDTRESISVVRTGDKNPELTAVFSVMGRSVRLLNHRLETIQVVSVDSEQQRIRDVCLVDFDNDDQDELIISFTGPRGTELLELGTGNEGHQISPHSFRSTTIIPKSDGSKLLVFCDAKAGLWFLDRDTGEAKAIASDLVAATAVVSDMMPGGQVSACAIGTNHQGHWTAVGLDDSLNQTWAVPIGSQRFETQIESISYAHAIDSRYGIWAIAAADGSIKLVSDDGRFVDTWNLGVPIYGMELLSRGQEYVVVISTEGQVQGWQLSTGTSKIIPASSTN